MVQKMYFPADASAVGELPDEETIVTIHCKRVRTFFECPDHGTEQTMAWSVAIEANERAMREEPGLATQSVIAGVSQLLKRLHAEGIAFAIEGELTNPKALIEAPELPKPKVH
jgi:hypothetical protein